MSLQDCAATERMLSDFLAGELPDDAQTQLGQHLQTCELCRGVAASLFRQDRALTEFSAQSRLPALRQSIHKALLKTSRTAAAKDVRASGVNSSATLPRLRKRRTARRNGGAIFPLLAAAGLLLVAGLFVFLQLQKKSGAPVASGAQLQSFAGPVSVRRGAKTLAATERLELEAGDVVAVADGGQALVAFAGEATLVQLDPGAGARFDAPQPGKRIHLLSGSLSAQVAAQPPGKPMIFSTAQAEAQVVGTQLSIDASPVQTRLEVLEGKVRFTRSSDRTAVDVTANYYAVAGAQGPLAALPIAVVAPPPEKEQRKRLITQAEQKTLQDRARASQDAVRKAVAQFTEQVSQGPKGRMAYRFFAPQKATGMTYAVVLFLHGTGGSGADNRKQLDDQPFGAGLWALPENQKKFPCFIVAPQTTGGWEGNAHQLALQALDDVMKSNPIDPSRVYVTGLSSGGYGTFACLQARPKQFAAAVALSGWLPDPNKVSTYAHVPIWILHGNADTVINVNQSRRAFDLLSKAGADVRFDEFDKAAHGIFAPAYNTEGLVDWLSARTLKTQN
jgi:predicted esterase